jgi:hypothetical protein
MSESDVKYLSTRQLKDLKWTLKMAQDHLKAIQTGWGIRLEKRIRKEGAAANYPESKQYMKFEEEAEARISDIKKAMAIARKREVKEK